MRGRHTVARLPCSNFGRCEYGITTPPKAFRCTRRAAPFKEARFLKRMAAKGRPPNSANPLSDVLPWQYTHNTLHPNQKPVVAIVPLIEPFCNPCEIVLHPFAGTVTTCVSSR